ncbi:MAG TPA: gliding motility protein GldC [Phnomibacter sp.]|nr:gliding motility protein GldC [Phnomibacter sp.]
MTNELKESTITVKVGLDEKKVPSQIHWTATDSTADDMQQARAMMLNFWDGSEKAALRIDLWTKDMMVDEMVDFYYQTMMGMADSLQRSTGQQELVKDLQNFAQQFFKKFQQIQHGQQGQ